MRRRDFVTGLLCSASLPLALSACRAAAETQAEGVDVVEAFGFVPDGRTDNYEAFHRWAAHVNQVRGGHYVFPPGAYFVSRYRTRNLEARDPTTVINSLIDRADGLTISGYGARIRLNGAFHRSGRTEPGGQLAGMHYALFMPFEIHRSRNVTIKGFDMDGGVRDMSRDPNVGEIYAELIALHGCTGALLQDLDLHHCQTDAIFLTSSELGGFPSLACRDVTLRNVKTHDNARGGLAVIQVLGLLCVDCSFSRNGIPGKYLSHAPQFGVDIEPNYVKPQVDVLTGDIEFRNCEFMDNFKSALLGGTPTRCKGYLRVVDCRSSNRLEGLYHILLTWDGAEIRGGVHDAGIGVIGVSWGTETGSDIKVADCEIRSSGPYALSHYWDGNFVELDGVKIIGEQKAPGTGELLLFHGKPLGGRRNVMRNCDIFIPAARKSREQPYDYEVIIRHTLSEGNLFRTDLAATGGQHFAVAYGEDTIVRGDRFRGTAPGPQDSIRPSHNSSHDTRLPFSSADRENPPPRAVCACIYPVLSCRT
jgi:hypothetical protein